MASDITTQSGKGPRAHRNVSTKVYRSGWDRIFGGRRLHPGPCKVGGADCRKDLAPGPAGSNPAPAKKGPPIVSIADARAALGAEPRYRSLRVGETILAGDEFRTHFGHTGPQWRESTFTGRDVPHGLGHYYRRKI